MRLEHTRHAQRGVVQGLHMLLAGTLFVLGAAATAQAQACFPQCRDGYTCHFGRCMSACNPPCPGGAVCTTRGGAPACMSPDHAAPGRPNQPPVPTVDRHADGGLSLGFMAAGGYSFAYMDLGPNDYTEGPPVEVAAYGHLAWLGGTFELQYGLNQYVYLGFSLGAHRFVNSDDNYGTAMRIELGPTLLLRPARPFYIGVDLFVTYLSFDTVEAEFDGHPNRPGQRRDLDLEVGVGAGAAVRLGFIIEVTNVVAILPELRFSTMPGTFTLIDADASNFTDLRADGTNLTVASAGLFLGTRIFL